MRVWDRYKKINDSIFLWFVPEEIILNFGSEQRLQAQTFTLFAMLCFLAGFPNIMYLSFKYKDILSYSLIFIFPCCFAAPLFFLRIHRKINVCISWFVSFIFLFTISVYLFVDRPVSPILNWNLILLYFTIVAVKGRRKNVILFAQISFSILAVIIKFTYGENFQLIQLPTKHDLGRVLGNMFFTSICTFLLTKVFIQIQMLDKEQNKIKGDADNIENRLRATQRLAAGLAHEINNPLTIVSGNLRRLEKNIEGSYGVEDLGVTKKCIKQALAATSRIEYIIKRLTKWTTLERTLQNNGSVDAETIVNSVLLLKKERMEKQNIKLNLQVNNQQLPIKLSSLEFVLEELLDNAIDSISSCIADGLDENATSLGEIFIRVNFDFGWCIIQVGNTGLPIKKEDELAIFDPFYSGKERGTGNGKGMGLSVAYSIVNRLNGKLTVKREEPYTVFCIHVPILNRESKDLEKAV